MSGSDDKPRGSLFDAFRDRNRVVSTELSGTVPRGLRIATAYSWRFLVVAAAIAYLLLVRGRRQVFVLDGGERVTVDWDSPEAEAAGYVNGALPKGAEPGEIGDAAGGTDDAGEAEPDRPEDDAIADEPASEEPPAGTARDDS